MDKLTLEIDEVEISIKKEIMYEDYKGPLPDIIEGMIRPALKAHGFDNEDINRRFVRSARDNGWTHVLTAPEPQSDKVTIAFHDKQGNPLFDTDEITPLEISLDQDDFILLLNQATREGLPFDKYINKIIETELKKVIEEKEEAHGGCE